MHTQANIFIDVVCFANRHCRHIYICVYCVDCRVPEHWALLLLILIRENSHSAQYFSTIYLFSFIHYLFNSNACRSMYHTAFALFLHYGNIKEWRIKEKNQQHWARRFDTFEILTKRKEKENCAIKREKRKNFMLVPSKKKLIFVWMKNSLWLNLECRVVDPFNVCKKNHITYYVCVGEKA